MFFKQARNHGPADNLPITRIVMHGTVSPCRTGQARATAEMFATTKRDASTQYVVDPGEVVQCVKDTVVAYGAPPNKGAIHIEQCDPQAGKVTRWQDDNHQAMLHRAAALTAVLCHKYSIPIRKIDATDLKRGKKGICGHSDVSAAWHQTTHTDPGVGYPWEQFIKLVTFYSEGAPVSLWTTKLKNSKTGNTAQAASWLIETHTYAADAARDSAAALKIVQGLAIPKGEAK